MAVHDRRYKRILTSPVFAYDVARLLAYEFNLGTVDRLLELCEDRARYYDIHHMDRREDPDQPLLRLAFAIKRAGDPGGTVSVAEAVRALADEEAALFQSR